MADVEETSVGGGTRPSRQRDGRVEPRGAVICSGPGASLWRIGRAVAAVAAMTVGVASRAEFAPEDFLQASGPDLRADHGKGRTVTLRGTNLGGWFLQEPWMCPTGFGRVRRAGWTSTVDGNPAPSVIDGRADTAVELRPGRFLTVEFPSVVSFDRIALTTNAAPGLASDWEVQVQGTDASWRTVKVRAVGMDHSDVVLSLAEGVTLRGLRVRRNAAKACSIAEINLFQADDYTVRTTLVDRFGEAQANELLRGYQNAWIKESDLDQLQSWGMSVVRVPINWLDFMTEDGAWKPGCWDRLDWLLTQCDRRRIYVIIDLHGVPGGASPWASSGREGDDGRGQNPHGFWTDPRCLALAERLWGAIAERYRGRPVVAGYDLVNEPVYTFNEAAHADDAVSAAVRAKSAAIDRLYRAVRKADPDHLVIVAAFTVQPPGDARKPVSVFDGITAPPVFGWTNVVYETHHYDMDHAGDPVAQERLVRRALEDIDTHRREWNVPIYVGEYNFYDFGDIWAKWMRALNERHISWTSWTYKVKAGVNESGGGNWGFFNSNPSLAPNVVHDTPEEIARGWSRGATEYFVRNSDFIALVRRFTADEKLATAP